MPSPGVTPTRTIRVKENLWSAAKCKAAAENRTLTSAIIELLRQYVESDES